jgi:hypothetical protein
MNREPSVLDYVKSLLRGKPIKIPYADESSQDSQAHVEPSLEQPVEQPIAIIDDQVALSPELPTQKINLPWRSLLALGLALAAQISLQPQPNRAWLPGLVLYLLAGICLVWAVWKGELSPAELPESQNQHEDYRVRARWLYVSLPLALAAFLTLGGNRFNKLNFTLWVLAIIFTCLAFWQGEYPFIGW